jgi:hypothetical protein
MAPDEAKGMQTAQSPLDGLPELQTARGEATRLGQGVRQTGR